MRKYLLLLLALLASPATADHHLLPGATQITYGSYWALGPTAYQLMIGSVQVQEAIYGAQNAWQHYTDRMLGRLGGWGGYISQGDCPTYPFPQVGQIGAYNFTTTFCSAQSENGLVGSESNVLAYVDWYRFGVAGNGTKSISINLHFVWSVDPVGPAPGQYDLQAVVAHEFGHVFGFAHSGPSQSCEQNPNKETMSPSFASGGGAANICERSLAPHDLEHANSFY